MTPLKIFAQIASSLNARPFDFWSKAEQIQIATKAKTAIGQLKGILEKNILTNTIAYKALLDLEASISDISIDEATFVQKLANLMEVYRLSSSNEHRTFLDELSKTISEASPKILEYHIGLESLKEKASTMTQEEKDKSDMEIIQKIGIFYILEYTIYILSILPTLSEDEKKKLFYEGLKTKEANLPPYAAFAESFRRDLCLKIIDEEFRNELFRIFFDFEAIFNEGDLQKIYTGFKELNLKLLKAIQKKGVKIFKTVLLSPFGKSVPMDELIKKIEGIKV